MDYEGEKFLLKLYRELYNEESVKHSGLISDNKYELINKYLKRIEKTEKVFTSDKKELIKYLKNRYYDRYIIKKEDIISNREDTKEKIIKSQKESLDRWIDYLMKEEINYPMWVRYWAFQGMLKLGRFDKDNKTFTKRSKKTTSPFVELNKQALKDSLDLVVNTSNINDEEIIKLVENGSFSKIYAYYVSKQIELQKSITKETGIWKEYSYGDATKIANDLNDKNTGWCLTSKTITKNYLDCGKIYIYYTADDKNNYTIPRICIRLEENSVAEVKGTLDSNSNIEYSMINIAEEKLNHFFGKNKFTKIAEDLKKLTSIHGKNQNKQELTIDELRFLYEIDYEIGNFGWGKDNRIKSILETRDKQEDLSKIFNCEKDRIATSVEDIKDNTLIYYGNIEYNEEYEQFIPPIVIGGISIKKSKNYDKLKNLQIVVGDLFAVPLTKAESLSNLTKVTGRLDLEQIETAKGLEKLESVGKSLDLKNLKNLNGLESLEYVGGNLDLSNAITADGASLLKLVQGNLNIPKMIDLTGFKSLELVQGNLITYASSSTKDLPDLVIRGNNYFYHMINVHKLTKRKVRKR